MVHFLTQSMTKVLIHILKPEKNNKRRLQTSIFNEYACRNPQQNSVPAAYKIPHHDQVGFIPGKQN